MARLLLLLALAVVVTCAPVGFTTFFQGASCPPGWQELPTAQGRLIVATSDPSQGGITVNKALSDLQDPEHVHTYTNTLNMTSKNIAAISCCNGQGACAGNYEIGGTTSNATVYV
jgi:hypothetical protein